MLKNNITTDCPTYEELNTLYPDTTNQKISGEFITDDNGYYHRDHTLYHNQYKFYQHSDELITWIDPPADTIEKIPRIIIQPGDFDYKIKNQVLNNTSTYMIGQNRYVSSTCTYMMISAANWFFLLGDTIQYLVHDCDINYTNFNENKTIEHYQTYHDITTSYKYQLDNWFKEAKENATRYLIPK